MPWEELEYLPTPEEIETVCREIRETWSDEQYRFALGVTLESLKTDYHFPRARFADTRIKRSVETFERIYGI